TPNQKQEYGEKWALGSPEYYRLKISYNSCQYCKPPQSSKTKWTLVLGRGHNQHKEVQCQRNGMNTIRKF
ncbi:hypothetical protein P3710_30020, partial [Vibrio parahaemolyticus]|nr:hypothetical protein [Vibrio parahaemolyticus]